MALAKHYEEILERLHSNVNSINYLIKPENRWIITDDRWQQILANLNNQIEKAEKICKELSNKDLLQLQNEIDNLKKENIELRQYIDDLSNKSNVDNISNKQLSVEQAIIFRHKIQDGFTQVLLANYKNDIVIHHKDFPEITDYLEGKILDVGIDVMGNIFSISVSDRTEIEGFTRISRGRLKMIDGENYAMIKSKKKIYVPEWICENFYRRNKWHKVYYMEVDRSVIGDNGEIYDSVVLQTFIIEN